MLRAAFARTEGRDRIDVRRGDGSTASWCFPTYGGNVPHDLVHMLVESGFGLRGGFWARVDAGADPHRVNETAMQRRDRFAGFGARGEELLAAEGLTAVSWFDTALDDHDMCMVIRDSCARFGTDAPQTVTPERVAAVREALRRVRAAWLRDHELTLSFCTDAPEATVDRVLCGS
jgi:hypothetical protein